MKVISVEHLSKSYRLGQIGTGTFAHDLNRWWARMRKKPNPMLKIGEKDLGNRAGEELWALKDVSFTVEQGEVLGIIGRNGAGKSTLLKILSRVTAPTTGKIKVKGRIASLLEVGTGFHPELTGRENIYLNGAILGMSRKEIDQKFDEIVNFAEVEKFIDTPVKRYSSGMYVRLAFAVAAHLDPEILVVDEVLAVGDAEFQKKCLGKMGDVAREGRTVLFVSHNMTAISNLCQRALLIQKGQLLYDGEKEEGINQYLRMTGIKSKATRIQQNINELPSDPNFRLLDLTVYQEYGDQHIFYTSKPTYIEIEYEILKPATGFRVGFDLKILENGQTVFRSFHDDAATSQNRTEKGHYVSKGIIPADFLFNTAYEIDILAAIHNIRWIIREQISIVIEVINSNGVNSHYADKRPGVLMPKIAWSLDNK